MIDDLMFIHVTPHGPINTRRRDNYCHRGTYIRPGAMSIPIARAYDGALYSSGFTLLARPQGGKYHFAAGRGSSRKQLCSYPFSSFSFLSFWSNGYLLTVLRTRER